MEGRREMLLGLVFLVVAGSCPCEVAAQRALVNGDPCILPFEFNVSGAEGGWAMWWGVLHGKESGWNLEHGN